MKVTTAVLALSLAIPFAASAQDSIAVMSNEYPNTYSSGSANVYPFTQDSKRFNDWAISAGVGVPLVQHADLRSIKSNDNQGKDVFGYSAYLSVDKAITHSFGLNLQYDRGETRQGFFNTKNTDATATAPIGGRTQYDAISILGDINFSNLLRRVDNKSPYRWALHGYGGLGTMGYRAYIEDVAGQRMTTETKLFDDGSLFAQAGAGLKYKINSLLDAQARVMYVFTADDRFDGYTGGGNISSDNFWNATLGLSLKLVKHESHLMSHDPLQVIYYK